MGTDSFSDSDRISRHVSLVAKMFLYVVTYLNTKTRLRNFTPEPFQKLNGSFYALLLQRFYLNKPVTYHDSNTANRSFKSLLFWTLKCKGFSLSYHARYNQRHNPQGNKVMNYTRIEISLLIGNGVGMGGERLRDSSVNGFIPAPTPPHTVSEWRTDQYWSIIIKNGQGLV